jgi:RecG-like helicase
MIKHIKILAIICIVLNSKADTSSEQSVCINDALIQILKTDQSKKERLVIFNETSDDDELKELLSQLKQNSENTFYVIDLDTLWNWDRENEMRFIYKILDLMNRNYEVESLNPSLKSKYLIEARHKCKGLT